MTGLPKPTITRLTHTLSRLGYLKQVSEFEQISALSRRTVFWLFDAVEFILAIGCSSINEKSGGLC